MIFDCYFVFVSFSFAVVVRFSIWLCNAIAAFSYVAPSSVPFCKNCVTVGTRRDTFVVGFRSWQQCWTRARRRIFQSFFCATTLTSNFWSVRIKLFILLQFFFSCYYDCLFIVIHPEAFFIRLYFYAKHVYFSSVVSIHTNRYVNGYPTTHTLNTQKTRRARRHFNCFLRIFLFHVILSFRRVFTTNAHVISSSRSKIMSIRGHRFGSIFLVLSQIVFLWCSHMFSTYQIYFFIMYYCFNFFCFFVFQFVFCLSGFCFIVSTEKISVKRRHIENRISLYCLSLHGRQIPARLLLLLLLLLVATSSTTATTLLCSLWQSKTLKNPSKYYLVVHIRWIRHLACCCLLLEDTTR